MKTLWFRYAGICLLAIGLCGCEDRLAVLDEDHHLLGEAVFDFEQNYGGNVKLVLPDETYTGTWKATKEFDPQTEKKHRLISAVSYQAYMQGNTPDVLKHGVAQLATASGRQMTCDFTFRAEPTVVNCVNEGHPIVLLMRKESDASSVIMYGTSKLKTNG